jgi:hypothetical protein
LPHLGFDPTPGDPEQVRVLARGLGELHGDLATTVHELDRLDTGAWRGEAAKAFVAHVDHDVAPLIRKAHTSFGRASTALARWAEQLAGFQAEADALEREAAAKQGALDQARSAAGLPPDVPGRPQPQSEASPVPRPDPAAGSGADARARSEAAAAAAKERAVTDAGDALDAVRGRARELHDRYIRAAGAVSHDLDKAGDIAPDKPGLFHRIAHAVEGAWNDAVRWVEDHAELIKMLGDMLSALTGVLAAIAIFTAPFEPVGAIFAGAALVAGAATLATHLVAMAAGADVSWVTLGFDVVGVLPGIGGFTKGAKIAHFGKIADEAEAWRAADTITEAGGRLKGGVAGVKTYMFFGENTGYHVLAKGTGIVGRGRAAVEGAIQFERDNQVVGTKLVNTVLKVAGREPMQALTRTTRLVDGTVKVAGKVPAALEIRSDVKVFDKEHPKAASDIKTAAKLFATLTTDIPG